MALLVFLNGRYRIAIGSVAARRAESQAPLLPRRRRLPSATLERTRSERTVEWIKSPGPGSSTPAPSPWLQKDSAVCLARFTVVRMRAALADDFQRSNMRNVSRADRRKQNHPFE